MKNYKLSKDRVAGIACLAISIFFGINTRSIRSPLNPGDPGGKLFPLIGCVILFICGIAMLVRKDESSGKEFLSKSQWKRALILFLIYILIYVSMWLLGTIITAFLTLFVLCLLFSPEAKEGQSKLARIIKSVVYAALVTVAIYLIYVVALKMQLPKGLIMNLFR